MGSSKPAFNNVALRVGTFALLAFLVGRLGFSITWVGIMSAMLVYDAHRKQKAQRARHRLRAFRQAHDPAMLNRLFQQLPPWVNFSDVEKAEFVSGDEPGRDGWPVGLCACVRVHVCMCVRACVCARVRFLMVRALRVSPVALVSGAQVSDTLEQMWPMAKVAAETTLKSLLTGIFAGVCQEKGSLLSKLSLIRLDLGQDAPKITGINVHEVGGMVATAS